MKNTKTRAKKKATKKVARLKQGPVEVNNHGSKMEVIIRHGKETVRVLCDDDGIHLGSIKERK